MSDDRLPTARAQRVHELGLKLAILLALTATTFLATRAIAVRVHARVREDAAVMHREGLASLEAGRLDDAVSSLRRAATRERGNSDYALDYARVLRAHGQPEAAERALLLLRTQVPEHPVVNLELARLAGARDDEAAATRYYRYALYAPWPNADDARHVREELVGFLLRHGDRTRAIAELIAARATTPDQPDARVHLGQLFMAAEDPRLALEEFRRALQLAPDHTAARRAAGEASYDLGNYAAAARYLGDAAPLDPDQTQRLNIARAVVSLDPLAPRIPSAQRADRLQRLIAAVQTAADSCPAAPAAPAADDRRTRLRTVSQQVRRSGGRDTDVLSDALDATYGVLQSLGDGCDVTAPAAQAVRILGVRQQDGTR